MIVKVRSLRFGQDFMTLLTKRRGSVVGTGGTYEGARIVLLDPLPQSKELCEQKVIHGDVHVEIAE